MKRALIVLFLPVFASFILLGCDATGTAPDSSTDAEQDRASEVENLTGKELYRGFLFGQGKVASMFPEIFDTPETLSDRTLNAADQQLASMDRDEIRKAYKQAQSVSPAEYRRLTKSLSAQLVDRIKQSNPDFFRQFERRMKSGNPMKVSKALATMSEVTTPALAKILDVSEESLRTGSSVDLGTGQGKCVLVAAVVTVAAVANVAVTVNGAVNVNVAVNVNGVYNVNKVRNRGFSRTPEDSPLNQEMLTRRVAARLAT